MADTTNFGLGLGDPYEATLRPYEPSWKDILAAWMMGNGKASPERRAVVEGLTGSSGLGTKGLGVLDATPIGAVLGAQEALQKGDYRGAALAIVPPIKAPASALMGVTDDAARALAPKVARNPRAKIGGNSPPPEFRMFPQYAERYPDVGPPVPAIDKKTGKEYLAKQLTPDAEAFAKARAAIQKDMNKNGYTPYFDPAKRYDANLGNYPAPVDTTQAVRMTRPVSVEKYERLANSPEATQRLEEAYLRGMKQKEGAGNWYQMGQLEDAFIKEYGPKVGPAMYKERFADSMAATTGGADPTANLLMAQYGNYLKTHNQPVPSRAYEMPTPIGGQYASTNMEHFRKMLMEGGGITEANPKRYNFSYNFLGNKKGATIDEQMSGLFQPGMQMPPTGSYGHYEGGLANRAKAQGVDPRWYQEVAWAGAKDAKEKAGYVARPMISHVNDAIERTSRLTGMSPEEVVRRGLVRGEIPMYGLAGILGLAAGAGALNQDE